MTSQEMYEHIQQLGREMGVRIWVALDSQALAGQKDTPYGETGDDDDNEAAVWLSHMPDEPHAYLVALHELGHQVDPRPDTTLTLSREAYAWEWAVTTARIEMTPQLWCWIAYHLNSYLNDRLYKRTPDFDTLLDKAERNATDVQIGNGHAAPSGVHDHPAAPEPVALVEPVAV